jgi:hypothetical protein
MLIATLMILPTVLERFSDAAKVVLLDDAAQPKLWGAIVQICTAVEILLLCFRVRDTVESPKTCIVASLQEPMSRNKLIETRHMC